MRARSQTAIAIVLTWLSATLGAASSAHAQAPGDPPAADAVDDDAARLLPDTTLVYLRVDRPASYFSDICRHPAAPDPESLAKMNERFWSNLLGDLTARSPKGGIPPGLRVPDPPLTKPRTQGQPEPAVADERPLPAAPYAPWTDWWARCTRLHYALLDADARFLLDLAGAHIFTPSDFLGRPFAIIMEFSPDDPVSARELPSFMFSGIPGGAPHNYWRRGNTLVLSSDPAWVNTVSKELALDTPVLAETPEFQAARQEASKARAFEFIHMAAWRRSLAASSGTSWQSRRDFDRLEVALGLEDAAALALWSDASGLGTLGRTFGLEAPAWMRLMRAGAPDDAVLRVVPADSCFVVAGRWEDPKALWQLLGDHARAQDRSFEEQTAHARWQAWERWVPGGFLALLEGAQPTIACFGPPWEDFQDFRGQLPPDWPRRAGFDRLFPTLESWLGDGRMPYPWPLSAVAMRFADAAQAQAKFEALAARVGDPSGIQYQPDKLAGGEMWSPKQPHFNVLSFGRQDAVLVLARSAATVRRALAAAAGEQPRWRDLPLVSQALERFPAEPALLAGQDRILQLRLVRHQVPSLEALPRASGVLLLLTAHQEGLRFSSPLPVAGNLLASIILTGAQADKEAQRACGLNLRVLYRAIEHYRRIQTRMPDRSADLPPSFRALTEAHVHMGAGCPLAPGAGEPGPAPDPLVWRGYRLAVAATLNDLDLVKQGDRWLCWETEIRHGGKRQVLCLNGTILAVDEAEFSRYFIAHRLTTTGEPLDAPVEGDAEQEPRQEDRPEHAPGPNAPPEVPNPEHESEKSG